MAKKASNSEFSNHVLEVFLNNASTIFNYRQVAAKMQIENKEKKEHIKKILTQLTQQKKLTEISRGKYKLNPALKVRKVESAPYITGVVEMKQTGKAYITTAQMDEDVMIAPNNTHNALHGDTVKVYLFPKREGRKLEGEIIEIISRAKHRYVGILQVAKWGAFLIPDNPAIHVDIFIPLELLNGGKNGLKAVVEITDWPEHARNPFGKIITVLGKPGDNDVEMNAILAEFEFPLSFPKEVEAEAEKINETISAQEIAKRRDFRDVFTLTIDPENAKDFDDALSLRKLANGNYEVGVHIADVSHYVQPNSIIDDEAYNRGTSVYLVDRVIPMLPEKLSNNVCSLRPKEDKLCFAAVFELTPDAEVVKQWFGKTVINSNRRFNYEEAQQIIENKSGEYHHEIQILHQLAQHIRDKRFNEGSIAFEKPEVYFVLDAKGHPIDIKVKEYKDSNKLIEEFMLLANKKVAELIGKLKLKNQYRTFVYRIHDLPSDEKLHAFAEFVNKFGYKIKINSQIEISQSINHLLEQISGKPEANMIETLAIRAMAKAKYSTDNIGHYGLAFEYYTHFTSPIRRYPDLMVHRLLEKYLLQQPDENKNVFEEKCLYASKMEQRATEAERASIKYKQVEYLLDKVGETFIGHISGVSKWGIFVEIENNKCEGMVRMKDLDDDFYYLDEENYAVIGQRNGITYKLGDKVKIKIKKADLSRKQLDFIFVN